MHPAIDAMLGAIVMGCFLAAVFFARFWAMSRDRFHGFFTIALVLLGLNWVVVLHIDATGEPRHIGYGLRLVAFLLIAAAVIDKNRRSRR